jgi:hypothetical protein
MRKTLYFFLLLSISIFAQDEYVKSGDPIYNFLDRMEALHLIKKYNSFETPKTRKEIAGYLTEVIKNENQLNSTDKKILNDYKIEYEFDLYGTLSNSQSLIDGKGYDLLSQNQKYLYYYNDPGKFNLFINLLGNGEFIGNNSSIPKLNGTASLGYIGGELRGTIANKFGFDMWGINGNVFGSRTTAALQQDINYNAKFNQKPDENFFDETQGYMTADFDIVKFKFGRDRLNVGYGPVKPFLDDQSPMFTYLSMEISYKFFTFSYFHGSLLGQQTFVPDSVTGGENVVEPKYIGYHRIGFNLSDAVNFGAGEFILYGDRPLDFSYVNPFALYTSLEHSNFDRDNALMFFDYNNKSIKGLKLYGTFMIDDINLSKITTAGWYGNKFLYTAGLNSYNLYSIAPIDFKLEYIRLDPYVFSHRLNNTSYTNAGYNLGSFMQPNSELFFAQVDYQLTYRLSLSASYSFDIHGANPVDQNGNVIRNVGGDISLGFRTTDSEIARFLDGYREYLRQLQLDVNYEPYKEINFSVELRYLNNSLQTGNLRRLESYITVNAQI